MEAICSSEMSVASQQTTWRHIPEDDTLHNHRCKDLKSYMMDLYLHSPTRLHVVLLNLAQGQLYLFEPTFLILKK
jgi:hypothetical protein